MAKKFLIGQLACFGDCLYATTIAKQIKTYYPNSHITWAVAERYKSIIELNPHVDALWEVKIANNDYYDVGWRLFQNEALKLKSNGVYDEIIFSQINPLNWIHFDGTIRRAILNAYRRPITVDVKPIVRLSNAQVENVKYFVTKNDVSQFKNVVLFESVPGSGQSMVNLEFAIKVSIAISEKNPDTCFILSSANKFFSPNKQVIDASELSYIENAELTKYCTHLVGCSSGITWLSTSDWAKHLPMLQLLNPNMPYFAGINFDFQLYGIDNSNVIEMINFCQHDVEKCIQAMLDGKVHEIKREFNQIYKPTMLNYKFTIQMLMENKYGLLELLLFGFRFHKFNSSQKNEFAPSCFEIFEFILKVKYVKFRWQIIRPWLKLWR